MSQFHWHVTDSQSFPLQVPGFTELSSKGAYDSSMVYSPKDVQDIVAYAEAVSSLVLFARTSVSSYHAQRGIDVMVVSNLPSFAVLAKQPDIL